ncbi:hypothetical protein JVT61DRAFT_14840 [Boletus reticuloceps]|uniref:Uncharacterized protein n=1 Tax=Boletus reticuloceps TaxID=495285 RepID=A0A8I3A3Z6_9AGAM|nr:hypothetical protein JVT61DRAFT_14840 [Boletus reticuloceps]
MWRSATFHLLVDLCSPTVEPINPCIQLTGYARSSLTLFDIRDRGSPLVLMRNHLSTHIITQGPFTTRRTRFAATMGLNFMALIAMACIPVFHALGPFDVRRCCTYELQSEPYRNLQKYVDVTSHTSNEVLANQADCHKDLSVHEYIAFGHLRAVV